MNAMFLSAALENWGRFLLSRYAKSETFTRDLYALFKHRRATRRGRLIEKRERDENWRDWLDVGGEA